MSRCRLLVCRAPEDESALTIDRAAIDAALMRAGGGLSIDATFLDAGDAEMPAALAHATALVGWRLPTGLIRTHGAGLKLIQLVNAGIDNLAPFDWLAPGTALCNARGIHAAKLREWAGMVLLMLHTQMPFFATAQRNHAWSRRSSSLIGGKTVLIFGTGALGGAVAGAASSLGLHTIGVRRHMVATEGFDEVIGLASHATALRRADFVVLTLPLTVQTRGLADAAFFAGLRAGAGFANFGRGGLVDQAALCAALESGALAGAIIDVATPEPLPPESPLWRARNLIITPHVSCDDPATYVADSLDLLTENLLRLAEGRALRNRVDPARGY